MNNTNTNTNTKGDNMNNTNTKGDNMNNTKGDNMNNTFNTLRLELHLRLNITNNTKVQNASFILKAFINDNPDMDALSSANFDQAIFIIKKHLTDIKCIRCPLSSLLVKSEYSESQINLYRMMGVAVPECKGDIYLSSRIDGMSGEYNVSATLINHLNDNFKDSLVYDLNKKNYYFELIKQTSGSICLYIKYSHIIGSRKVAILSTID